LFLGFSINENTIFKKLETIFTTEITKIPNLEEKILILSNFLNFKKVFFDTEKFTLKIKNF
jgi:hypothetical protein